MHSTEREMLIGAKVVKHLEKQLDIYYNVEMNERVEAILDRIVAVCDRKELVYTIKVIDRDEINALAIPGGYVYVFRGLVENVENDDQLAGVIAHEVGHITARHSVKRMQMQYGHNILVALSAAAGEGTAAGGISAAMTTLLFEYSQEDELESDRLGVKYMRKAGYDPMEMKKFLEMLHEKEKRKKKRTFSYFRTHPGTAKRISAVYQAVTGKLDFKHYLNLMGEE